MSDTSTSMNKADLLRLLAGDITPTDFQTSTAAADPNDPYSQYASSQSDLMTRAQAMADQVWQQHGGQNVLGKYEETNYRALVAEMYKQLQATETNTYKANVSAAGNDVDQQKLALDTTASTAKYGSPEQDFTLYAATPGNASKLSEMWKDPEQHTALLSDISAYLTGDENAWHSDAGTQQRVMQTVDFGLKQAGKVDEAKTAANQSDRWGKLPMQMRAKELYLHATSDPTAVVDPAGKVYHSEDEYQKAVNPQPQQGLSVGGGFGHVNMALNRTQDSRPDENTHGAVGAAYRALQPGVGPALSAFANEVPGYQAAKRAPGAAKAAWHWAFGG